MSVVDDDMGACSARRCMSPSRGGAEKVSWNYTGKEIIRCARVRACTMEFYNAMNQIEKRFRDGCGIYGASVSSDGAAWRVFRLSGDFGPANL